MFKYPKKILLKKITDKPMYEITWSKKYDSLHAGELDRVNHDGFVPLKRVVKKPHVHGDLVRLSR